MSRGGPGGLPTSTARDSLSGPWYSNVCFGLGPTELWGPLIVRTSGAPLFPLPGHVKPWR